MMVFREGVDGRRGSNGSGPIRCGCRDARHPNQSAVFAFDPPMNGR
jgi:hypothetical protein